MIAIKEALPNELNIIQDIAHRTWPVTYGKIISNMQLSYMLDLFYSIESLNKNIEDGHHFLIAKEKDTALGFASYTHNYPQRDRTKIPKIYILPDAQGKGIGKLLIEAIALEARKNHSEKITLNVNRSNPAIGFYKKMGFVIAGQEDIELEQGYLMEDYIMEKTLP